MTTPRRLRHALSVAEHGHFGRAAEALHISQPALTKSIQALEAAVGVKLFDRARGRVVPTAFGELVVRHGGVLLHAEDEMLREIKLLAGLEVGALRISLGPYPSVLSGYAAVGRLIAKHPKISVSLHVADWREVTRAVNEEKADLGLAELSSANEDDHLETELVGQHRARVFCRPGHPILARARIELSDLLEFPWVSTRFPPRIASGFPRPFDRAGRIDPYNGDFVPAIEVDVPMQLADLVTHGDSLAHASLGMVEPALVAGRLALVPVTGAALQCSYGFIHLKRRSLGPAAIAYMAEVRELEAEIVKREAVLERQYREALRRKGPRAAPTSGARLPASP